MNPLEINQLAQEAATKSDRYLFLLVLAIAGVSVYFAVRYLVGRIEAQNALLAGLFKEANDGRVKCAENLAACTVVIAECKDTICDCRDTMKECTDFIRRKAMILVGASLLCATGCTVGFHHDRSTDGARNTDAFFSLGVSRKYDSLRYGKLQIKGAETNETEGLKKAAEGVTEGIF